MKFMNKIMPVVFAAIIVLFGGGLFRLFDLMLEKGDIYPPYSSLRSDPLGARAVYEGIKRVDGISVSRNMQSLRKLPDGRNKTFLICGGNLSKDPEDVIRALEYFVADGGRLVLAFFPLMDAYVPYQDEEEESPISNQQGDEKEKQKDCTKGDCKEGENESKDSQEDEQEDEEKDAPWFVDYASIADRWDFTFAALRPLSSEDQDFLQIPVEKQDGPSDLPQSLSWHSTLYFDKPAPFWRVLYSWEGHPVIIERPWGRGSIVMCSDSYFLSNEAMRRDRQPELIAWLIGTSTEVVFDESHAGIQERQGVMTLIHKYHLMRLLAVVFLLALLFVWKNVFSLIPKRTASDTDAHRGKDSTAGLVNLLRRSIPVKMILEVCVDEWNRSHEQKDEGKRGQINDILNREKSLPERQRSPVKSYRVISALLAERD
jgi:hypothetical protein